MTAPVSVSSRLGPESLIIDLPGKGECTAVHAGGSVVSAIGMDMDDNSRAEFIVFCLTPLTAQLGMYISLTPDQARTFATHLNAAADMVEGGLPTGQIQ